MLRGRIARKLTTTVRPFGPEEVTSTDGGQREATPAEVDMDARDVEAIWRAVVKLYKSGLHPAVGITMRRRGKVVLDRALGHQRGNAPTDPWNGDRVQATPRTLYTIFSASKMVTAMLIHLLDQRGQLHIGDRVAHYIPEFGKHGKEWVTIRHILTHRAGIPTLPPEQHQLEVLTTPERILEELCEAKPVWVPGRRLAYHALTGGFVLGEVIKRVTGKDVRQFLHDEIVEPLGLDYFNYGVPEGVLGLLAENAFTGPPVLPPLKQLFRRALGVDFRTAAEWSNDPRFLTSIVPAGNIVATANDCSRFMQLLLNGGELDGVEIFEPRTIQRALVETAFLEVDLTMGFPVRYSAGFMLGSDYASLLGRRTKHAYGHLGFTNVVLWADPERDISVALMTSGKPFLSPGQLSWLGLMQTISRRVPRDWGR